MKQTKHFKRTAFPLSAKSMLGTLLLLIAMLVPQGAWATDFISEVKYGVNGNQGTAKGYLSGYTIIDHDFNNGTSGDWVYIGYKTSTNAADAITGLLVVVNDPESTATTYGDSGFKAGGAKTMMVDGKRYYLAESGGNADMNHGNKTHKNPVYLYYTKDGNTTNGAQLITTLGAHRGELTTNPAGLSVVPLFGGNGSNTNGTYSLSKLSDFGDTNKGGGGSFNYITYTTHTHSFNQYGICSCGFNHVPSGNGTSTSPYEVEYYTDLVYLGNLTRNGNDTFHAIQTKDIDCGGQDIVPLGGFHNYNYYYFKGTYDGGGHVIKNAKYVNTTEGYNMCIGVFGHINSPAIVKNLGVVNSTFGGSSRIGAVCGLASSGSTIDNCFALNNTFTTNETYGGICGLPDMTITNCYSDNFIRYGGKACSNCYSVKRTKNEKTVTQISADDITSGRLCYLINKNKTDGTQVWYQQLGTGAEDYPTPKKDVSKTVYKIANLMCDGKTANGSYTYTNNKNATPNVDAHNFSSSFTTDKEATCVQAGSKSKHCSVCDAKTEVTTISALNHSMTEHAAKPASCSEDGNLLYYTCSRACCSGKYYKDCGAHTANSYANQAATVTSMLSHIMTEHAAKPATCTEDGNLLYYTCSRACCSGKYYKDCGAHTANAYANQAATVTTMHSHIMTEHAAKPATCTDDGNLLYYTCSRACCSDKYYKDNAAHTANAYADLAETVVAAAGHHYEDGTCTVCDYSVYDEVTYLDANGKQQTTKAIKLTADMEGDYVTTDQWGYYLASGWYYVEGELNLNNYLNLGDGKEVNIILADGCVWNEDRGISAYYNTTLNIYCQSQKTGTVNLMEESDAVSVSEGGTINIYGGTFAKTNSNYDLFYVEDGGNLNFYDANVRGLVTLSGGHITLYGGTFTNSSYKAFRYNTGKTSGNPFQLGEGKAFYDSEGKAVELYFVAATNWHVSTLKTYIVRGRKNTFPDLNGDGEVNVADIVHYISLGSEAPLFGYDSREQVLERLQDEVLDKNSK